MRPSPPFPVAALTRTHAVDLRDAVPGAGVLLQGWVHRRRELARITFLVVRDRTGLAQVVLPSGTDVPPRRHRRPSPALTANPQAPGGVEVTEAGVVARSDPADTPAVELWRPTLDAALPTRLDHAATTWRHPRQQAVWQLAAASLHGFRSTLDADGSTEVHSPKLVEQATESGANLFEVDYFGRIPGVLQPPRPRRPALVAVVRPDLPGPRTGQRRPAAASL